MVPSLELAMPAIVGVSGKTAQPVLVADLSGCHTREYVTCLAYNVQAGLAAAHRSRGG
jgi:hypothetical protein